MTADSLTPLRAAAEKARERYKQALVDVLRLNDNPDPEWSHYSIAAEDLITALESALEQERSLAKGLERPRIKVRRGWTFYVDLGSGTATDTFALGPVDVFKGKQARKAVAIAEDSPNHRAACNSVRSSLLVWDEAEKMLLDRCDPVPVVATERRGEWVDVEDAEGARHRFQSRLWDPLAAISTEAMVDRDRNGPALFLVDGSLVGLLMPLQASDRDIPPLAPRPEGAEKA
jgi:hypothetical protein